MRIAVITSAICLCLIGLSTALDAKASIRKDTNIPAGGLGPALQTLAKQHDFQVLYRTEVVGQLRTEGATGDFTSEEALKQLLKGTGLTYRYLDEKTITIVAPPSGGTSAVAPPSSKAEKERPNSSAQSFLLAQATAAQAQVSVGNAGEAALRPDELQEVVVTGRYEFLSADTSGTTNLPLPIEQVPQSISLVSEDFIKAADLKTLGEIAEYTPGAINAGEPGNFSSVIKLRGFSAGRAVDGINVLATDQYEPDYAIFDRLEVVKGPSSVVYGVSSPGGLVNFVTKSATPQTVSYLQAQIGSWNSFRLEGQLAVPLDSDGRVRGIGIIVRDQGDSFIYGVNHAKTALYGGINADFGSSVTAYLHGGYERYVRVAFDGLLTEPDGTPAPLPRSFLIGSKNMEVTSSVYHAEGDVTWHATDMMDISLKGNYERSNATGDYGYGYGLSPSGDISTGVFRLLEQLNVNYGIGLSSIYRLDDLGLKNSFISVAALYQNNRAPNDVLLGFGSANVFDGQVAVGQAFDSLLKSSLFPSQSNTEAETRTISAQSVLQPIDPLSLLLGASYSKPDATLTTNGVSQNFDIDSQISYRAGLMYEFMPRAFAYGSFSQSYSPQLNAACTASNGTTCLNASVLPPLKGDQYEIGVKHRTTDGRLLLTGGLFKIIEKNVAQFDQAVGGLNYYKPIGEVTHRGAEFQALGRITPQLQINFAYSFLDPKITQDSDPMNIGRRELFLPRNTASLYTTYTIAAGGLRGLSFGGGARYVDSQQTSYDGSTRDLPGYTVVDATIGYALDKWLVQLNARNIFDRHYYINEYQTLFFGNEVGDPTSVTLGIRRQF